MLSSKRTVSGLPLGSVIGFLPARTIHSSW